MYLEWVSIENLASVHARTRARGKQTWWRRYFNRVNRGTVLEECCPIAHAKNSLTVGTVQGVKKNGFVTLSVAAKLRANKLNRDDVNFAETRDALCVLQNAIAAENRV